jgi:LysR family hydrogen peroxide-inducible transcriptional activator
MTARQQQNLRYFKSPPPMREVSMVVHRHFVKKRLIEVFKQEILKVIPEKVKKNSKTFVIPIDAVQ